MDNEKLKQPDFLQAMKDIKKMLLATHKIKQVKNGYDYNGVDIEHSSVLGCSLNIKDSVKEAMILYDMKEQGRDFLYVILSKIFQLGYSSAQIQRDNSKQHEDLIIAMDRMFERQNLNKNG